MKTNNTNQDKKLVYRRQKVWKYLDYTDCFNSLNSTITYTYKNHLFNLIFSYKDDNMLTIFTYFGNSMWWWFDQLKLFVLNNKSVVFSVMNRIEWHWSYILDWLFGCLKCSCCSRWYWLFSFWWCSKSKMIYNISYRF